MQKKAEPFRIQRTYTGNKVIIGLTLFSLVASLFIAIFLVHPETFHMPRPAYGFTLFWLFISILATAGSYRDFISGYLAGAFSMMIAWRIAAMYEVHLLTISLFVSFILLFLNYFFCAYDNLKSPDRPLHRLSLAEWQLVFFRIYLGFNFIPHFTEKLFAGPLPREKLAAVFTQLGVPHPEFFVWTAGLCEFGAAIALCLGFLMRLGAFGAALYLLIATYLGHHFSLGFIWANPGGGWEFGTLWMLLALSFAVTGLHAFSIDQQLEDRFKLPNFIKKIL